MGMALPIRKTMLVVAVATLIALAGCTGGNGPSTATPTNNSTDSPQPMEDLDGAELSNNTVSAVENGGSYSLRADAEFVANTSRGNSSTDTDITRRANFETDRGVRSINQSVTNPLGSVTSTATVYTDGNTSYRLRNVSGENATYASQTGDASGPGGIRPVNVSGYDQSYIEYTNITQGFDWEANGTATVGDTTTIRYSSTNVSDSNFLVQDSNSTLTNASADLYVDEDGVVRRTDLTFTIENGASSSSADISLVLTDIGSTTVEEPSWVAQAESS